MPPIFSSGLGGGRLFWRRRKKSDVLLEEVSQDPENDVLEGEAIRAEQIEEEGGLD